MHMIIEGMQNFKGHVHLINLLEIQCTADRVTYTMMLLMGMWMSLTKKPMNPMMANPMAVAMAIFWNSAHTSNG